MSSRNAPLWTGALRDDTKDGCVANYVQTNPDKIVFGFLWRRPYCHGSSSLIADLKIVHSDKGESKRAWLPFFCQIDVLQKQPIKITNLTKPLLTLLRNCFHSMIVRSEANVKVGSWWEAREKIRPWLKRAHNPERATPILGLCLGVFLRTSLFLDRF